MILTGGAEPFATEFPTFDHNPMSMIPFRWIAGVDLQLL
jgi:hypothetical protein